MIIYRITTVKSNNNKINSKTVEIPINSKIKKLYIVNELAEMSSHTLSYS